MARFNHPAARVACWQNRAIERTDAGLVALLAVALVLAVFASLAETSLLRASQVRIQVLAASGDRSARRFEQLQHRLSRVLNAVLLLALLSQIGAAALAGLLAQRWFGNVGVTISSVALTIVLFIYGEAIPKTYAVRHAEQVGRRLAGPLAAFEWLVRPAVSALVWLADIQAPGRGVSTGPTITEQELKLLAHSAAREGEITEEDRRLIERTFRLGDRHADDVMVPRTEIVGVEIASTRADALAVALRAGHRRLPVYEDDLDAIVGVVHIRDLAAGGGSDLLGLLQPTIFVPESKRVLELLREMQRERIHLAVVVDEHGGTAGIITVEDVVEVLFGDISTDPGPAPLLAVGDGWEIQGTVPVDDLEGIFGPEVIAGEWNTVAGLVMGTAGRVLGLADEVKIGGWTVTVTEMDGRRISRVRAVPADGGPHRPAD